MDVTARKKKGLNFRLFEGKIGRAILIASFVILTIGLPLVYLFTKNQTPVSSWFNNSWEYRKIVQVDYSGSTVTNYDILLTVDTAALILEGKIQNDCDDIRFVDEDDTTSLSYWIENGCNTAQTSIWVRIPSLPNGGKMIFMYYGNGSAISGQLTWSGNLITWYQSSCPVGWTRVSAADGRFLRGASSYGLTGGSSVSSHTVSCNLSNYSGGYTYGVSGGSVNAVTASHSHTGSATVDNNTSVLPAYMNWVLCSKSSVELEADSISLSQSSSIPGWDIVSEVDSKFPLASASYGGGGGSDTHQHTVSAGNAVDSGSLAYSPATLATGGTVTYPTGYAAHSFTSNGTFTPSVAMNVQALVVGGGGGGGGGSSSAGNGAGGGGGKVEYNSSLLVSTATSVTIGAGGVGGTSAGGVRGTNGGDSIFSSLTANGGGGGGAGGYSNSNGLAGGNGGGGAPTAGTGGTSNDSGYAGGAGSNCNTPCRSGGGGGAGGAGTSGVAGPGNGGVGYISSIIGTSTYYGGGGGGSGGTQGGVAGTGGLGGGGAGINTGTATSGTANTGGGGGGGGYQGNGGAGGSGVVIVRYPYTAITTASSSHTHPTTGTTTSTSSNLPEYTDMVYQSKQSAGQAPTTVIPMFSELPPLGWTRYSDLDNKFARGAPTFGGGGGNNNHTHTTTITAGTPVGSVNSVTWTNSVGFATTSHSHSCTNATTSSTSNIPPYFTVIYGTKKDNSNESVTYQLYSEESNVPLHPSIAAAQAISSTSIRWNFIDNANNETGFKVFDTNGNLKATCVGANLSYCDETGLQPNTQYTRNIRAYNANGDSLVPSGNTSRYTLATTPSVTFGNITSSSIEVTIQTMNNFDQDQSGWYYDCTQVNCDNGSFNTWVTTTSLVDTGLNSNTQYTFRVKARNGDGVETAYSVSSSKYTLSVIPEISFNSVTSSELTLGSPNFNNFGVDQSAVMYECVSIDSGECDTGNIWDGTGAQTLTQLQTNKEYEFRAKARNGDGVETDYSDNYSVVTAAASPLELTITDVGNDSLRIILNSNSNGNPSDTEYLVRNIETGNYLNPLSGLLQVSEFWGTYADFEESTGILVEDLEDGVLYGFEVKARNSDDVETNYSNNTEVYTLLNTPTLVSGQALSSSSIRWNFTENTANEEGVKIYDGGDNVVATCNGADLTYCDETSLSPNTSINRRVALFNEDVESAKSNQESAYTRTNVPGAPSLSFGLNQVQITINTNSNPAPTLYSIVEQSGEYVQSDGTLGVTEVKKNLSDWGTINVTGLSPNTSYTFSVKAENGDATHQTTSPTSTGFTLASALQAPTVTGASTTSMNVVINYASNPLNTQFAIYHVGSGQYVDRADGQLVGSEVWGTYSQWGSASGINVLGMSVNSQNEFKVKARNGDGVEGALSDSGSGYTFANTPSAPSLTAISATVIKVVVNQNSNPSNTLYSMQINNNLYINYQTGTSQASPDYATYAQWGGVDGIGVTGLSPNGGYSFRVNARSGDNVNTGFSSNSQIYSLANVPGIPDLERLNSTSAKLVIDNNGNPSSVEYVIQEVVSGDFIALNGSFSQSEIWGTSTQWGGSNGVTVNQLVLDTNYEFRVKARNSDNVQTAYSATTNSYSSLGAPVIGSATVLDSTTIRWSFTETLSNELGFRILNSNGDQVAQCATANITYCDEYGLTPNTSYTRFVVAYDGNGNGDISENSAQATTFALVPAAPTVTQGSNSTTLNLVVNLGDNDDQNPPRLVVRESISGYFVNDTGALTENEFVGSYSDFGQDSGTVVTGLFANARYVFEVKAVNMEDVSTAYSSQTAKYTKVAPLGTPVVEGVSDTSLRVKVVTGGNPPFTQYQIKDKASGKFVPKNGGALTNTSVWGTYAEFGSSTGIVASGLTSNTSYVFEISARNGDQEVGSIVESNPVYTYSSRPDSLLTNVVSARELNVILPTKYAGSTERFAIFTTELNRFVNAQGQFVEEPVWLTYNQFGGVNGVNIAGLTPGKGYTFQVKTRNISNVETAYSNGTLAYTQPLAPIKPEANVISTTGARLYLIDPGNDATVLYAIQEVESGKFVSKINGNLVEGASWGTYDEFGGSGGFVVKGLLSASDSQFRVRARNLGQVASSYSESVLVQTNALIYNVPSDVKATLASDANVDVSQLEGSQRGTKTLSVTKSDILVAQLSVKFDSDKDWGNVVVDSDTVSSKAVVKLRPESGLEGTFTLYTPANDTDRLRVCPESKTLTEVTTDCVGGVIFEGEFPITKDVEDLPVIVSKEEIDGTLYWVASGLKGTGAIGESVTDEGKEPTVVPDPEPEPEQNPPLVIDINAEQIVQSINNETVKSVAKAVLVQAPQRTVLAMKQVSDVVETTALGNLDQPQLEVVSTVATATTVTVGLAVLAGGFVNIPYLVVQLVIGILSFFGFVKKSRPYGLVYDSITKKPIDRAVVRVYNMSDKLVWTDVTSAFGTFGANLPIGRYKILVVKPGYKFPSTVVSSPIDYPLEPVYHGEVIKFNRRNEFNIVIPMDQIEKKGIAKTIAKLFSSASILVKLGHILLFLAGFLLAVHTVYLYPSSYNLIALIFYVPALFLVLRNLFIKERSKGMVIDRNGNPIAGVTVTLKEMRFDKFVAKRVTDKNGEYQMIVPNGTYQLGIMDEGYRAVRYEGGSSIVSRKRKGKELVIDRAIIVRKK